jgi:hypothetical protein
MMLGKVIHRKGPFILPFKSTLVFYLFMKSMLKDGYRELQEGEINKEYNMGLLNKGGTNGSGNVSQT